jgi:hypothetical protein
MLEFACLLHFLTAKPILGCMQEKEDRASVVLPWQHEGVHAEPQVGDLKHSGSAMNDEEGEATNCKSFGHIIYVRDSDNDCDSDEDPDDDLDI